MIFIKISISRFARHVEWVSWVNFLKIREQQDDADMRGVENRVRDSVNIWEKFIQDAGEGAEQHWKHYMRFPYLWIFEKSIKKNLQEFKWISDEKCSLCAAVCVYQYFIWCWSESNESRRRRSWIDSSGGRSMIDD